MVAGGLLLMSYTTRLTPGTSFTMRLEILPRTSYGSLAQSAVIPSSDVTARIATTFAYVRPSPMTPTDRTGVRIANDCHTLRYSPAALISSMTIQSASRSVSRRSAVTSPRMRIARPGPGNGWRWTIASGSPSACPTRRTSSLNR